MPVRNVSQRNNLNDVDKLLILTLFKCHLLHFYQEITGLVKKIYTIYWTKRSMILIPIKGAINPPTP